MALDERYIVDFTLSEVFVNKDTGEPLAGGKIYFYEDEDRNTLKPVYELTGSPPNYTYSILPNYLTLSAAGKIQDGSNNDVAVYFYPYDQFGNVQNYYIAVYDSDSSPGNGTPQFTREAWPNVVGSQNPTAENAAYVNMLTNPQFHDVFFDTVNGLTVSYTGSGETTVDIGPGWILAISHTNTGTCVIGRTSVAGTSYLPTNPPYTLDITPGVNCSGLELRQRLTSNPAIWSPIAGNGGYLASSLTFNTGKTVSIEYRPSTPGSSADQEIFAQSNTTGSFAEKQQTTLITAPANTSTSDSGYVDIVVNLETSGQTRLTSVQVVATQTDQQNIAYRQDPANRLEDYTFNFYNEPLQAKPIPSELVGWDFPLNPAQFGETYSAAAIGANKSAYVWDQTIAFQTVDSGFSADRTTTGSLEITIAQDGTQVALVQYLTQDQARELLTGKMAVHVAANKSSGVSKQGLVSLWWTTGGSLPDITAGTNNSIVLTLDANGKPATFNGTWNEVERDNLGDARFTLSSSSTSAFNETPLKGWNPNTSTVTTGATTATYFAIVVGFESMDTGEKIDIQSISLQKGNIPTKPAPQTKDQVLRESQRFYWKTFKDGAEPAQGVGADSGEYRFPFINRSSSNSGWSTTILFPSQMAKTPDITFYNPVNMNANAYDFNATADAGACSTTNGALSQNGFNFSIQSTGVTGNQTGIHLTADARLGA